MAYQIPMPFLSEIDRPVLLPEYAVALCKSELDAIKLCINQSHYKYAQNKLADELGIDRGHMSCILNGTKNFPSNRGDMRIRLQEVCGNLALHQYEAMKLRTKVTQKTIEEENAELRQRLAEAERKASEFDRLTKVA